MDTLTKKQQDLEKEIEEIRRYRIDNKKGKSQPKKNTKLKRLKTYLKGIKFAKEEILKEIEDYFYCSQAQNVLTHSMLTCQICKVRKELKDKLK